MMLIEFKFSNYRSFRDEAILSMEATRVASFKNSLIEFSPSGIYTESDKTTSICCYLREEWWGEE